MHERKVRDVEKVFHNPRATRVDRIRAAKEFPEASIMPLGKGRHLARRLAKAGPDQAIPLDRAVGLHARLTWRGRVG
jgi:hypothetical protein